MIVPNYFRCFKVNYDLHIYYLSQKISFCLHVFYIIIFPAAALPVPDILVTCDKSNPELEPNAYEGNTDMLQVHDCLASSSEPNGKPDSGFSSISGGSRDSWKSVNSHELTAHPNPIEEEF